MGLGHVRRNLMIAQRLLDMRRVESALLVCGASEAACFPSHPRIDFITLPSFRKASAGYEPRSLSVSASALTRLRSRLIEAALEEFAPDVLVVDKWPLGVMGELAASLERLTREGRARCVLGLRDVLDDPVRVAKEWDSAAREAVEAHYDAVWVYGDRRIYDVIRECGLEALQSKVRYAGYLDREQLAQSTREGLDVRQVLREPFVLCTVGGGEDGERLATAFALATYPGDCKGVLLTGPFLSQAGRRRVDQATRGNPRLGVIRFAGDPSPLFHRAERVVAMGGYNTVCELLSARQRALIVPRCEPRREQWIRAERFRRQGLIEVCLPDDATPEALGEWFARDVRRPQVDGRVDLSGLSRLPGFFDDVVTGDREEISGSARLG
jgi:predicted glycosyltransferase